MKKNIDITEEIIQKLRPIYMDMLIEIDRMGRLNLSYIDAQPGAENLEGENASKEEKKDDRKSDYNRDRRDYRGPRRDRDFHKEGRNEKKENKDAE